MSSSGDETDESIRPVKDEPAYEEIPKAPPKRSYTDSLVAFALHLLLTPARILRPYAPNFVPFIVISLFIPLVVVLSAFSGWMVWKNVATDWHEHVWLQYGDQPSPYAFTPLSQLSSSQPYEIYLSLQLPATEANLALGNFMIDLRLADAKSNQTLACSRRPAIALPPPSSSVLSILNPLSDRSRNLVTVQVPLLASFTPSSLNIRAELSIGRADHWRTLGNGYARELSVVEAKLHGRLVYRGIKGWITRFPLLFSFLSAASFASVTMTLLATCVLPVLLIPRSQASSSEQEMRRIDVSEERKGVEGVRRHRSFSRSPSIKSEHTESTLVPPSSSSVASPLRKRRSRIKTSISDEDEL